MASSLPSTRSIIRWYDRVIAFPIKMLSKLNIGPFGGNNSVSAVIEGILAHQRGEEIDFELSKTESFLVEQLKNHPDVDELIEYRELNHAAQKEVINRYGTTPLGVIWLGGGIFTLEHPLLKIRKSEDQHIWTDAHPRIMQKARSTFDTLHLRGEESARSYDVMLPEDAHRVHHIAQRLVNKGARHLVFQCYGVSYVLPIVDNYRWLTQIDLPEDVSASFIFNAPGSNMTIQGRVTATVHNQPFYQYDHHHIATLFQAVFPGSEIIWSIPRTETRNKVWETWLVYRPAKAKK